MLTLILIVDALLALVILCDVLSGLPEGDEEEEQ